jgi:hypothetical protein
MRRTQTWSVFFSKARAPLGAFFTIAYLLLGAGLADAQTITRGPYLQLGTSNSIVVRWRTSIATDSRVQYGSSPANLSVSVSSSTLTTEHVVTLTGLSADTLYYYSVGTTSAVLAGADSSYFFATAPTPGTAQPTRVWVIGDSGTANANAAAVRDAYLNFTGTRHTDLWLMLGDNAYQSGTDAEYQNAVFNMYPTLLRQSVVWPTLGNHDGATANSATQSGPYYDIFTLPKNGEAGGLSSGTEAYYSFDYGNIHFVVLDSFETSRAPNGAMLTWLANDLAATNQPWIIAYFHHPPYSKGSHDSDTEIELIEMRQNALPILEAAGVDLVMAGHSHSYERSFLLDGHYGASTTLTPSMILDGGSGREDGTGAYQKSDLPHDGAVYVVAGTSGLTSGGALNHPAMFISLNRLGSLVLDVDGNRLDARFIDYSGATGDYFTIIKGGAPKPSVTIAATTPTATEAGTVKGVFTVSRTGDTSAQLTVFYAVTGSATAGSDYATLTGSVTIPGGASAATIDVTPIDDASVEANETVIVTLAAAAEYTIGNPAAATVTIVSDDVLPSVSIAATTANATEAGPSNGVFTVTRSGSTASALTVNYAVSGTATPVSDYGALSGSVTIPIGAPSATITVTPVNDTLVETNETVIATLSAASAYTVGSPSSATVTIISDDVNTNLPTVTVSAQTATAHEARRKNGKFRISRTGSTATALTVLYAIGGTATAGSDYVALSGSVTIPAGATRADVLVTPIDDNVVEPIETVIMTLAPNANYLIGTANSATVNIVSND